MERRLFIAGAITSALAIAANRGVIASTDSSAMKGDFPPIDKTREDWQKLLDAQQYKVLFEEATERPWTSPLNDEKREGKSAKVSISAPLAICRCFSRKPSLTVERVGPASTRQLKEMPGPNGTGSFYFLALNTIAPVVVVIRGMCSMMAQNLLDNAGVTTAWHCVLFLLQNRCPH
jgi:hypothetical protein